ncbi:hypothetical protein [Ramlibacter sp. Leaf400]|uniref:hypothetical protein n=1 Tax=Ramlibacter sp. Leaf400 TaxID=1736365 RepID=UPI0006F207D5|nr:hypothetical protein [Ramlibacter sp. Leaf400]KQT10977.1 hypothetical protein ASG30_09265 [Ramlibacter sp. Leaf400]
MAKSDPKLLTQAEYARSRKERGLPGGSREAVRKAVEEGRISAFGPDKLIDRELADAQWERNTRARLSPEAAAGAVRPAPEAGGQDLVDQAGSTPAAPAPAPAAPAPAGAETGYSAARARREIAEAEQAEIDLRKAKGELVAWQDVARGGFEVGRELRDTMESAVNALAAELAAVGSAEQCAEILRRHNRAVCDVLVKSWREKIGPAPVEGLAA